ncbi:MAG: DUF72 domain-containing protein [Opitutus sp.]
MHGDEELYASGYSADALATWVSRIRAWNMGRDALDATTFGSPAEVRAAGRDVMVYFDNDIKTHAPFDAMALAHRLGLGPPPAAGPIAVELLSSRGVKGRRQSTARGRLDFRR